MQNLDKEFNYTFIEYPTLSTTQPIILEDNINHTIDLNNASASITMNLSGGIVGVTYVFNVIQHASVLKDITWQSAGVTIKTEGGATPVITQSVDAEDLVTLFCESENVYKLNIGQDYHAL
jgi:hypothetical protein